MGIPESEGLNCEARDAEALRILGRRGAVPPWFESSYNWAGNFHRELTSGSGWPEMARTISQIAPAQGLGPFVTQDRIRIPANVPAFLRGLLDVVDVAVAKLPSQDSPLQVTWPGLQQAVGRLAQIVGSIRDANMPMFPVPRDPWTPGVIAASHFCYLHELAHTKLYQAVVPMTAEQRWANEFQADEIAFATYALTLRSHPELQGALVYLAPVLALYMAEVMQLATNTQSPAVSDSHPPTRSRLLAIRDLARVASREGMLGANPLPIGDFYSRIIDALLVIVGACDFEIVSPIELSLRTLIADIDRGIPSRLQASVNHLLRWYFLADWTRLSNACHQALGRLLSEQPGVFDILSRFIDYAQIDCADILSKHDFIGFLQSRCLFDRDCWETLT